jgi:hypothetical protein
MAYPLMYDVSQLLVSRPIADIPARVQAEMARWPGWHTLKPGAQVAVTAGSRGIANIALILRCVCSGLVQRGFTPFIVPAMGSHGGATVEGQLAILTSMGITEQGVGAPIRASLEVDEVGRDSRGHAVVMDRHAHRSDGLIVVARIKKHTDFYGTIESGLMKMVTIGLGKHINASYVHSFGWRGLRDIMPEFAGIAIANSPALFGLGLVEDGYDATSDIVMIPAADIAAQEPKLLRRAVRQMARIPVKDIDLLIVDWIGKEISGTGMDTNVIGRYLLQGVPDPPSPRPRYLAVLDLTEASHGNAIGIGLADLTTQRLMDKFDQTSFYMNSSTSGFLQRSKIPLVCPTDQAAIDLALRLLAPTLPEQARVVRIQDTLHLARFRASHAVLGDLVGNVKITVSVEPQRMAFSGDGRLR